METVSLEELRILPPRGIRCPRAEQGPRCRGSACSCIRLARVPHAKAAHTREIFLGGGRNLHVPLWVLRPLLILRSVSARKACSPLPAATAAPSLHSYRYYPNIQVHHVLLDRLSLPEFKLRDTTDFLRGNVINFTQVLLCASSQLPTSCADFKINAFSIVCCAFMHLKSTWIFCELIR